MDRPTTTISELPNEALTHIMAHVPLGRRLQSCALVSRACAAAAGAATQDVAFKHQYRYYPAGITVQGQLAAFQAWLDKHAQQLVSLQYQGPRGGDSVLRLPYTRLARLQTLDVQDSRVELVRSTDTATDTADQLARATAGGSSASDILLPALVALRLHNVKLPDADKARLLQLRMPGLNSLQLRGAALQGVEEALLPHAQLAVLHLDGMRVSHDTLALSSMQRLQALALLNIPHSVAAAQLLGLLQPSVTALHLQTDYNCTLVPSTSHDDNVSALMSALAQLTRLQSLQLQQSQGFGAMDVDFDGFELWGGAAELRAYSALTASSQLSALKLISWEALPLPRGALQHAFPPDRKLPHLRELELRFISDEVFEPGDHPWAWCMDAADVNSIAAACPGLRSLSLGQVLKNEPETAGSLTRLQQLSSLSLSDATGWLTAEAAATLAHMSSLRELEVGHAEHLGDVGLQHWTALRQLTKLYVCAFDCGISMPVIGNEDGVLELKTQSSEGPDVWSQLVRQLEGSPQIHKLRMEQMQERLDAAEARADEAQARAGDAEARLAVALAELRCTRGGLEAAWGA